MRTPERSDISPVKPVLDPDLLELDLLNTTEALFKCLIEQKKLDLELGNNPSETDRIAFDRELVQVRQQIGRLDSLLTVKLRQFSQLRCFGEDVKEEGQPPKRKDFSDVEMTSEEYALGFQAGAD